MRGTLSAWGTRQHVRRDARGVRSCRVATFCLQDVTTKDGELLCDHVWIDAPRELMHVRVPHGSLLELSATVTHYLRGMERFRFKGGLEASGDYGLKDAYRVALLFVPEADSREQQVG